MGLAELQLAFGAHLRDPDSVAPPPGLDERRVRVYRELVFNNIEGLMANNFPVINAILGDARWLHLVREFLRDYRSINPYFPRLGHEFIKFLDQRQGTDDDPAFLLELAHYENVEFDLYMADDEIPCVDAPDSLHSDRLYRLAATAMPLAYQFQVHQISEQWQPDKVPDAQTLLLVFQDREGAVKFYELQGLTYHLLVRLVENRRQTLSQIVFELADNVRQNDPNFAMDDNTFLAHAVQMLDQFAELGVLRECA